MKTRIYLLAALLSFASPLTHAQDKAAYIPSNSYFTTLTTEIAHARHSITAYIYLFPLRTDRSDALTFRLAEALAAARARGVQVEVVLDEFGGFEGVFSPGSGNNEAAYTFLESKGVDVSYDASPSMVHAKAVVIDGETVLIGSNNWSEAAFTQNVEACLLVRDKKAAKDALEDLSRAGRKKRPPEEAPAALIPVDFLTDPRGFGALVANRADQSLDTYLYLCKLQTQSAGPWLKVDFDDLAQSMGIAAADKTAYRAEITVVLRKELMKRFGLIEEARFERGEDAEVRLKPFPAGETFSLPSGYWEWGWNRRLSLRAKAVYLLNRRYFEAFSGRPRWSLSGEELTRRHHVSNVVLSAGTTELKRANLVEVEYDVLSKDASGPRKANVYTPNPLYDPRALEARWAALEKTYGREALKSAHAYAALVFEDSDADLVERLILLERARGRDRMEAAAKTIGAKKADNPKRNPGYFIGIVNSLP